MSNVMRQEYRPLNEQEQRNVLLVKDLGAEFYQACDGIGQSRELSLAKTKIEEAVMWAVKHVTRPMGETKA